jgi:hypothetical protein
MLRFIVLDGALSLPPQPTHIGKATKAAAITRICRRKEVLPDQVRVNFPVRVKFSGPRAPFLCPHSHFGPDDGSDTLSGLAQMNRS